MNNPFEYDIQEKQNFDARVPSHCENCETRMDWYLLTEYQTEDGQTLLLCEDCCQAERTVEDRAAEMANREGCAERVQIIGSARTCREMVNRLTAHDMECTACKLMTPPPAQCAACMCDRKDVVSDRLVLHNPAAVCCGEVA